MFILSVANFSLPVALICAEVHFRVSYILAPPLNVKADLTAAEPTNRIGSQGITKTPAFEPVFLRREVGQGSEMLDTSAAGSEFHVNKLGVQKVLSQLLLIDSG